MQDIVDSNAEHTLSSLHEALSRGNLKEVGWLIDLQRDIHVVDEYHNTTVLHVACDVGVSVFVYVLLESGADVNKSDRDGWTPLHYACSNEHFSVAAQVRSGLRPHTTAPRE